MATYYITGEQLKDLTLNQLKPVAKARLADEIYNTQELGPEQMAALAPALPRDTIGSISSKDELQAWRIPREEDMQAWRVQPGPIMSVPEPKPLIDYEKLADAIARGIIAAENN